MENEPCGAGLRPTETISLEEYRVGGTKIRRLKTDPQLSALCLLADLLETSASHLIALLSALSHTPSGKDPHMPPKF